MFTPDTQYSHAITHASHLAFYFASSLPFLRHAISPAFRLPPAITLSHYASAAVDEREEAFAAAAMPLAASQSAAASIFAAVSL